MDFRSFGKYGSPTLLLIPGLGVSYEIFLPLIGLLEDRFHIIAAEVDGFTLGLHSEFTSVNDQAAQVIDMSTTIWEENLTLPTDFHLEEKSCLRFLRGMKSQ